MIIAVSLNVYENPSYDDTRDSLSHDWIKFLDGFGITPILIPNSLQDPLGFCSQFDIDGILLTSGNDVSPLRNESWIASESVSLERDTTEFSLLKYASLSQIPLIGVCRGLQCINAYYGGKLVRDITSWTQEECHVAVNHKIDIVDDAFKKLLGASSIWTNSYHNQGVVLEGLSPELRPVAVSHKGVVESLIHKELPILAIQWHPERRNDKEGNSLSVFGHWLSWCRNRSR